MTSPYQNSSDDTTYIDENRLDEQTNLDGDPTLYDQTHLIESFHPGGMDTIDDFDTHERIEIELTPATTIMRTVTSTPTPTIFVHHHMTHRQQQPPLATKTTRPTHVTMENNNRKHERIRTGNRQHNNSKSGNGGGGGGGGGRKHGGGYKHQQHQHEMVQHRNVQYNNNNNREMSTSDERDEEPTKVNNGGKKASRNNRKGGSGDDFEDRFELKVPHNKFEWDTELEMSSTISEMTTTDNKRKQSKAYESSTTIDDKRPNKADANAKKIIKDSEIHIVKKEKSIDIGGQSTPLSTDSKIIEIKPAPKSNSTVRRVKRSAADDTVAFIDEYGDNNNRYSLPIQGLPKMTMADVTAAPLINAVVTNVTALPVVELNGIARCLQSLLGVDREIDVSTWSHLPSLEFINLLLAITVWSARYPAVFWGTSKAFSIIFSLQLIANGIDIVLGYAGASVLYKLQIVGQQLPKPVSIPIYIFLKSSTKYPYMYSILLHRLHRYC